jgi:uncharacterized protein
LKILVFSDIHYPLTNESELVRIMREERADKVIFLGDSVGETKYVSGFLEIVREAGVASGELVFIKGDEDSDLLPCVRSVEFSVEGRSLIFVHGDQFNVGSEESTIRIASLLHKISRKLPVLAYAIVARTRGRGMIKQGGLLVVGHSHALAYFPRLRVACAGCLTTTGNIYNDRGYIVIEDSGENLTLFIKSLGRCVNGSYALRKKSGQS